MAATASAFQIAQDPEKENPRHNMPLKEKILTSKSHVLQPLGTSAAAMVIGGKGAGGAAVGGGVRGVLSKQGRANFAKHNSNANVRAAANTHHHHNHNNNTNNSSNLIHPGAGNNKVAFRDVGNAKNTKDDQTAGAFVGKKSSVVPLEQFKTFSVYEDQNENEQQQQLVQQHEKLSVAGSEVLEAAIHIEDASQDEVDKENVYREKQERMQQKHILTERIDVHKYEHEYVLDTTPMSVTDVLSPMSVDRSAYAAQLLDDSNSSKEIAEQNSSSIREKVPRNDRQRFYEVVEYQRNILEYFRESEKKHRPKPLYMRRQSDINYSMRTILVDWLVEVSEEYNLDTETLYLSVSYIDRFLSHMSVVRNKLQLVGTAAMYIASKYEEIYPPDVAEFVFITDDTYNKAQVLRMEQIILKILAFDLCTPTAYVYINTYAVLIDIPDKVKFLTLYISELSLLEADPYLRFYPSIVSSAALALARYLCDMPIWSPELEEITSYCLEDLKEVFLCLCISHNASVNSAQQAIQEKYKSEKLHKVSNIAPVTISEEKFDDIVSEHYELIAKVQKNKEAAITNENSSEEVGAMSITSPKFNTYFKF